MGKHIQVCGHEVLPGQKFQQMVTIPGTTFQTPVTIVNGIGPGKTLYIAAGIHPGEYPGVAALTQVAAQLEPAQVTGAVILLQCVNYEGMLAMTDAVVPEDGENLNRGFPGDINGTLGDRIRAWLAAEMLPQADFVIDLHSGGAYEPLTPCLFFPAGNGETMRETALAAAQVTDIPYAIASYATDGHYSWAAKQGIPGLLLERSGDGQCPPEQVQAYIRDVHNLMIHIGVLQGEMYPRTVPLQVFEKTTYVGTDISGFWYPEVCIDTVIRKGEHIGTIKDIFGNVLAEYFAEHDGLVFYHAGGHVVRGGFSNLVAYGAI